MKKTVSTEKRKTFRNGESAQRAQGDRSIDGPGLEGPKPSFCERQPTRQACVSPNAAYRHFANQADLLDAVRSVSIGLNPFHLHSLSLDRMQGSGLLSKKNRQDAEYLAWSTVLVLEGPLYKMRRRWCRHSASG